MSVRSVYAEFSATPWVKRVTPFIWSGGAGVLALVILVERQRMHGRATDFEIFTILPLMIGTVTASVYLAAFLIWSTQRLPTGWRRTAIIVYPLMTIPAFVIQRAAPAFTPTSIVGDIIMTAIYTTIGMGLYVALISIGRWVTDGFRDEK